MSELLPCPFCGSTDIYTEGPCYDAFMCNGCGVSQYDQPGHAEAIAAWNARASQAEIEALKEALTPSGETKAAYIGEFQFTVTMLELDESDEPYECQRMVTVPWTTIKEIMAAISERAALSGSKE